MFVRSRGNGNAGRTAAEIAADGADVRPDVSKHVRIDLDELRMNRSAIERVARADRMLNLRSFGPIGSRHNGSVRWITRQAGVGLVDFVRQIARNPVGISGDAVWILGTLVGIGRDDVGI